MGTFVEFSGAVFRQSFVLQYQTGPVTDTSCTSVYRAQLNTQWNVLTSSLRSLCQSGSSNMLTITAPQDSNVPRFQVIYNSDSTPVSMKFKMAKLLIMLKTIDDCCVYTKVHCLYFDKRGKVFTDR